MVYYKVPKCKYCGKKLRKHKNMGDWSYSGEDFHWSCAEKEWRKTRKGVCQRCKDEYEGDAPEVQLFLVDGRMVCGDCANEIKQQKEEKELYCGGKTE